MMKAFGLFLKLYPREYRDVVGAEMRSVFAEAEVERKGKGFLARFGFVLKECSGLLRDTIRIRIRLDESAFVVIPAVDTDPIAVCEHQIRANIRQMEYAIANHKFARARFYAAEEEQARLRLAALREGRTT